MTWTQFGVWLMTGWGWEEMSALANALTRESEVNFLAWNLFARRSKRFCRLHGFQNILLYYPALKFFLVIPSDVRCHTRNSFSRSGPVISALGAMQLCVFAEQKERREKWKIMQLAHDNKPTLGSRATVARDCNKFVSLSTHCNNVKRRGARVWADN